MRSYGMAAIAPMLVMAFLVSSLVSSNPLLGSQRIG